MKTVLPVRTPQGSSDACSYTTREIAAGRGPHLDHDLSEGQRLAVAERLDQKVGHRPFPVSDDGAGGVGELQVSGHEVGVEVRLEDPFDPQPVAVGIGEVLRDVALRIDDHGPSGRLVRRLR
jgi:hypothetical protein